MSRFNKTLVFLLSITLLCLSSSFAETIQQKKELYQKLEQAVDDPTLYIIPTQYGVGEFLKGHRALKEWVHKKLTGFSREFYLKQYEVLTELSNVTKQEIRKNLLPKLAAEIEEIEQQQNNITASGNAFRDMMNNLTSESHLDANSFSNIDNVISDSNQNRTSISSSNVSSFDRGWDNNENSCPKINPGSKTHFRLYPNGQNSGKTYLLCGYFKDRDINFEKPYILGKVDGKFIAWGKKNGIHYVRERSNWSQGKLNGLKETYMLSRSGAVYRQNMMTYVNGVKHGDSVIWYDNGQTRQETNFFNGRATLQYNYKRDGSVSYCTKWGNDGKPRDCKTGKLR